MPKKVPQKVSLIQSNQTQTQKNFKILINSICQQLLQNKIIESEEKLDAVIASAQQSQLQKVSNIINYLVASLIQEKENSQKVVNQLNQAAESNELDQENDQKILIGLSIFADMTKRLAQFSNYINKKRAITANSLPLEIYKHFRSVYELTEELSAIFNEYIFHDQQHLQKRQQLIAIQIKFMEEMYNQPNKLNYSNENLTSQNKQIPKQTEEYILALREQIDNLHQTLLRNDDQFTQEIHNYNKTLRQMSNKIKAYQRELLQLPAYQLKFEEMEIMIVRLREEKYRNQIVIENMARKIRKYQKEMMGDNAFLSPQRQRSLFSPESRISISNSKVTQNFPGTDPINHTHCNGGVHQIRRNNH